MTPAEPREEPVTIRIWDRETGAVVAEGLSVIMVSSEIPEILGMSDRVIVMREGRMVGEFDRAGLTPEKLVRAAAGIKEAA